MRSRQAGCIAAVVVAVTAGVSAAQVKVPVPVYIPPPTPPLAQDRLAALAANAARSGAEAAVTPLQVQAADPAFAGRLLLTRNPINPPTVAAQPLLPLGAARAMLDGKDRAMPLTITGRIQPGEGVPTDPKRRAYCNAKEERGDGIRCYIDSDGDGRFDTARWGETYSDDSPYTVYMVGKAEPLATPIAFATIDPRELPALELIYQGCRVVDRIQYSTRIGVKGDGDVKTFGCPAQAQPVGRTELVGPGRYRVDRVVIDVAYTTPEEATTRLVEPIAAGTLLDRIDVGKPVKLLGERKGWPIDQIEMRARYARAPYVFAGVPTLAAAGGADAAIVTGDYRYGYTARIAADAQKSVMFAGKKPAFTAGDALYGIPMQSPLIRQQFGEPLMMWCAPKERKPGDWRANCVQQEEVTRGVYDGVYGALWIEQIPAVASNSDPIDIVEGPVDLPQPAVRYTFWKWTPNRLVLRAYVSLNGTDMSGWRQVDVPRIGDGSALMAIAGGVARVTPDAAGTGWQATALRPFVAGASAQTKPAFLIQMLASAKKDGKPLTADEIASLLVREDTPDVM